MGVRKKEKKRNALSVKGGKDFVTWNAAGLVTALAHSHSLGVAAATLITPSSWHLKGKTELLYWQVWATITLIILSTE